MTEDSFSDVSEMDVTEGTHANQVIISQRDSSIFNTVYSLHQNGAVRTQVHRLKQFHTVGTEGSMSKGRKNRSESGLYKPKEKKSPVENQEMKECTFQPKINRGIFASRRRTSYEFLDDMKKYDKYKQSKLNELRESLKPKEEKHKFVPTICAKSKQLIFSKSQTSKKDTKKFYRPREQRKSTSTEENDNESSISFVPKVNKASKDIIRDTPISQKLYEDAIRRMYRSEPNTENRKISPSPQSIQILIKRFLRELKQTELKVDVDKSGTVNYTRFLDFLRSMKMLGNRNNEEIITVLNLWELLAKGKDHVSISNLKTTFFEIMGFSNDKSLHKTFKLLFENRVTANVMNKSQTNIKTNPKKLGLSRKKSEETPHKAPNVNKKTLNIDRSLRLKKLIRNRSECFVAEDEAIPIVNIHHETPKTLNPSYCVSVNIHSQKQTVDLIISNTKNAYSETKEFAKKYSLSDSEYCRLLKKVNQIVGDYT